MLDVMAKKGLCRRAIKNELPATVVCVVTGMEEAITLECSLLQNALLFFLLHLHSVIFQMLVELLEANTFELWQVLVDFPGSFCRHLFCIRGKATIFKIRQNDFLGRAISPVDVVRVFGLSCWHVSLFPRLFCDTMKTDVPGKWQSQVMPLSCERFTHDDAAGKNLRFT